MEQQCDTNRQRNGGKGIAFSSHSSAPIPLPSFLNFAGTFTF